MSTVRLCHLYPAEMSIYADRGNIAVLTRRLEWRGHTLEVTEAGLGEPIDDTFDIYYLGGGQDRDQQAVAADLGPTKAGALTSAVADGAVFLAVCGGYQLAGHGYTGVDGSRMPGMGLLDVDTVASTGPRLIGDVILDVQLDGVHTTVVGFENHAGRTHRGEVAPLGRVVHGHGNDGASGCEGATRDHIIGTYLHGPLLPKNPAIADLVLRWALDHAGGDPALEPLEDVFEASAHAAAAARAGVRR